MSGKDMALPASQDRAVAASPSSPSVSPLRASIPSALYTHHHYGWRRHELPNSHQDHLIAALMETHDFLLEYEGKYRVEAKRTPACSYDGRLCVYWDSDDWKTFVIGAPLHRGDHWFTAFEFNVAPVDGCRYCGGTGIDHYLGPFFHCWACDGTAAQIRERTWRGFMHKPTQHAAEATHCEYAEWFAAQAIETGDAE